MKFTVRDAMKIPPLDRCTLIAGSMGLDREVKSLTIMEVPDYIELAREGELLLTNCYSIYQDQDRLDALIPRANDQNLSCIVLKLRYLIKVPLKMIKYANKLNFPLYIIPNDITFNQAIVPVLTRIVDFNAQLLSYSMEINQRFTKLALSGGDKRDIISTLSTLINKPVSLIDVEGRLLAHAPLSGQRDFFEKYFDNKIEGTFLQNKIRSYLHKEELVFNSKSIEIFHIPEITGSQIAIQPLKAGDKILGYIMVWGEPHQLVQHEILSIQHAAVISTLDLIKQKEVLQVEGRYIIDFVHDLITHQIDSPETIYQRARSMGWDFREPHIVLLVEINNFQKYLDTSAKIDSQEILDKLERATDQICNYFETRRKVCRLGDSILIFWPTNSTIPVSEQKPWIIDIGLRITSEINRYLTALNVSMGISRVQLDATSFALGYEQAKEALYIGRRVWPNENIWHYDDLGIYRLLGGIQNPAEIHLYTKDILGKLLEPDNCRGELLHTLETFLDNNRNMKETAMYLNIHYNTLRYRLNQIEKVIGYFRNDPILCLNIQLAIKLNSFD